MKIVGFLCNRDGVTNGFLHRCLRSMALISDEICVYDDASVEDVWPVYREFGCTTLRGATSSFERELFHKQDLLHVALRFRPDWIVWFDSDAVLGRVFEDRASVHGLLQSAEESGFVRLFLHNLNLWRSPWWYRTDLNFNDLWHCVFWRNTGQLNYQPSVGLHQRQYPMAFVDPNVNSQVEAAPVHLRDEGAQLLHFGFANEVEIARKYFLYRAQGQTGGRLNRLVSEGEMVNPYTGEKQQFELKPVPEEWYPVWLRREVPGPFPAPTPVFCPEVMAQYASFDEWLADHS